MISRRRTMTLLTGTVAAVVAVSLLSACVPAPEPEPTPTAVFASEEEAFSAAEETYRAYNELFNSLDLRDAKKFGELADYTSGDYAANERKELVRLHAEGYVRGGGIRIEWFRLLEYDSQEGTLLARSCNDVSETTFANSKGESLVPPERPTHYAVDLLFESELSEWRLATSDMVEDAECSFE